MKGIFQNKKILAIIAIIIIVFIAYNYFFKKDNNTQLITSNLDVLQTNKLNAGKEIVALLSDLKSLQLNDDIFKNKEFRSLEDFSLPIASEPKGRNNPFAPIGVEASVQKTLKK